MLGKQCRPRSDCSEEQSDQGLHCLPFRVHRLDSLLMIEPHSSNFRVITTNFFGVRIFRKFTVIPTSMGLKIRSGELTN